MIVRALRLAGLIASFMNALVTQLTFWSMVPPILEVHYTAQVRSFTLGEAGSL